MTFPNNDIGGSGWGGQAPYPQPTPPSKTKRYSAPGGNISNGAQGNNATLSKPGADPMSRGKKKRK